MSAGFDLNTAWARALVQELSRGGVREAVVCPGSRSTPLALACMEEKGLRVRSAIDERAGGFFALGAARATGAPALLVATSGTAGAHAFPAVLEAEAAHVPLVVCTADRPHELHGWGAPQTIDQQHLFGGHVRFFEDLGVPEAAEEVFLHLRATAARAVATARRSPPGPAHLNAPFREPLAPLAAPPPPLSRRALDGEPGRPFVSLAAAGCFPSPAALDLAARELASRASGVIVCGPRDAQDELPAAAFALSARLGYPVLADGASNLRSAQSAVAHADLLLRHAPLAAALRPEAVIHLGLGFTSKVLQHWIDTSGAFVVQLADSGALHDPAHASALIVEGDAVLACRGIEERLPSGAGTDLAARFAEAEQRARRALARAFARPGPLGEPLVARVVAAALPAEAQLFVASSMPVRDLDAFAGPLRPRVLANRGANGIDGLVASAAGAALASGRRTALLTGDLALIHDLGGLLLAHRLGADLTVVVVNNDGGGIFSFLPLAERTPHFEHLFATPHGLDLAHASALACARLHRPVDAAALEAAVQQGMEGGLHLVEVRTNRAENLAAHRALQQEVCAALEDGPWS